MKNNIIQNTFNIFVLLIFIILSFSTFYITNIYFYISIFIILFLSFIIKKVSVKDIFKFNIYIMFSFVLVIFVFNLIFMTFEETINIIIKLILICNLSFILTYYLPSYKLIQTINLLLKPLKLFKINTDTINLILTIGITFIPILINEIAKIRTSLLSKGIKYNSLSNMYNMIKILIPNLFKKINEIDISLVAKGVNE